MSDTFDEPLTPVLLIQAEKDTTAHLVLEHVRLRMDGVPFNTHALILPEIVDESGFDDLKDLLGKLASEEISGYKIVVHLSDRTIELDA